MPLEDIEGPGKYINSLNPNWPVGGEDEVLEGDNHLRGIKNTTINSFPFIEGPVTADHLELSYVKGVTSAIQPQIDGKSPTDHQHNEYSLVGHTHAEYALANHTHSEYSLIDHTHAQYSLTTHTHPDYEARITALEQAGGLTPQYVASGAINGVITIPNPSTNNDFVLTWLVTGAAPNSPVVIHDSFSNQEVTRATTNAFGWAMESLGVKAFLGYPVPSSTTFTAKVAGIVIGSVVINITP